LSAGATVTVAPPLRPIRIVHLIDSLGTGGAERLLVTSLRHLDPTRFVSHVVILGPPFNLRPAIESLGVSVESLDTPSPRSWGRGLVRLISALRRWRPDVLHTHLRFSNVLGRLAALVVRTPVVLTSLHHLDLTYWPPTGPLGRAFAKLDCWSANVVNTGFIAVSSAVRDDYQKHFGLRDVEVIHNYVESEMFGVRGAGRADARRRLGASERDVVILNVARLAPEKGQRYLVDALATVRQKVPEARVVFVGGGPDRAPLQRQSEMLGVAAAVRFAGAVADVRPFLAAADIFVFPSLAEGFGIALAEAMAAGVPVVTTAVDGLAELVEDEVDGLVVPPRDASALADALLRLIDDPELRSRLAARARRTVAERFTPEIAIPRLQGIYTDLLVRRRGMRRA
jgi:glycosyltransferase involved in cell wall biosynthesis